MLEFAHRPQGGDGTIKMAEFVCKVGDTTGRVFQHVETAQSEDEARQRLADRGFYVFSVRSHLNLLAQLGGLGGTARSTRTTF